MRHSAGGRSHSQTSLTNWLQALPRAIHSWISKPAFTRGITRGGLLQYTRRYAGVSETAARRTPNLMMLCGRPTNIPKYLLSVAVRVIASSKMRGASNVIVTKIVFSMHTPSGPPIAWLGLCVADIRPGTVSAEKISRFPVK